MQLSASSIHGGNSLDVALKRITHISPPILLVQEMSYNNYLDADAAWNCVCEFNNPTCVIVKHTNPCGVASRDDIIEAYKLSVKADPVSAFGGIVAFNIEVDEVNWFYFSLIYLWILFLFVELHSKFDLHKYVKMAITFHQ